MALLVYVLCALTALACALLLYRAWNASRTPFLLWAATCFAALAVNNALLYVDFAVVPDVDLSVARGLVALFGIGVFVFGLVWKES